MFKKKGTFARQANSRIKRYHFASCQQSKGRLETIKNIESNEKATENLNLLPPSSALVFWFF